MKLSRRSYLALAGVLLLGLGTFAGVQWMDSRNSVTLPAGTAIRVSLNHAVSSDQSRAGDAFAATVSEPVLVDERTVIPAGAQARGVLVDAQESGRLEGVARLRLALAEVEVNGEWYDVHTTAISRRGSNHDRNNLKWIGGGAATGTVIGAIAAGGKGALIGGPIGAGAGVAAAAITGKKDIGFSAERELTFELTEPVAIKLKD